MNGRVGGLGVIILAVTLLAPRLAQATVIELDATPDVGDSWVSHYSIANDTLAEPIEEFTLFFDHQHPERVA